MLRVACEQLYGTDAVSLKRLDPEKLRSVSYYANSSTEIVLLVVNIELEGGVYEAMKNNPRYIGYSSLVALRSRLEELGASLGEVSEGTSPKNYELTLKSYQDQIKYLEEELSECYLKVGETLRSSSTELEVENVYLKSELDTLNNKLNGLSVPVEWLSLSSSLELGSIPQSSFNTGNTQWVFSGSSDSVKEAYKTIHALALDGSRTGKVIVVDLGVESCLDYYFPELVHFNSLDKGFHPSSSGVPNISVVWRNLEPLNPIHYLGVDWGKRFSSLAEEKVIVYGGSLSDMLGRFFLNSVTSTKQSLVVSSGLSLSLRNLAVNLRVIRVIPDIYLATLNPQSRVFETLKKTYTIHTSLPLGL